jgi:CHAT domain-containing protein
VEGFKGLPGVKAETESAAPLFGATPQLDNAFTKLTLESLLKGKQTALLHFGTHFVLDPASSEETYMVLGDGKKWRPTEMEQYKDLSFDGVELLVASACKTGVPTGDDASIEGFGAYCQVKGARSVLSSLWEVNDESTSLWMKSFYEQLAGGVSKGEAYHRAQLALITGEKAGSLSLPKGGTRSDVSSKTTNPPPKIDPGKPFVVDPKRPLAHPYYWAAFTLSGNWR